MSSTLRHIKLHSNKKHPLTIIEVAEAALLGDLALGLQLIGWFISIGALVQWFSVIPFALITVRHRKRATYFAMASAIGISVLIGGATLALQVFLAGVLGAAIGGAFVKKRNFIYSTFVTLVKGAFPVAIIGDLLLFVFSKARQLTINQIKVLWDGIGNIIKATGKYMKSHPSTSGKHSSNFFVGVIHNIGAGLYRFSIYFEELIKWITLHWYYLFPLSVIISMLIVSVAMDFITRPILKLILKNLRTPAVDFKTEGEFDVDFEESKLQSGGLYSSISGSELTGDSAVSPLPLELSEVSFKYAGADTPAVENINMEIRPGNFIGIVGQNGSGKSTLGKILIGMRPTEGTVKRQGRVGLGLVGGTSVIFQRPESQVLGSMVEDDVVWGLLEDAAAEIDIDTMLDQVGLKGFRKRETSQLSGGELQRLALASALARKPALLVSDESTALLDPPGRYQILTLLKAIANSGTGVIHISHLLNELSLMDEIHLIENGKITRAFDGNQAEDYQTYLEFHLNLNTTTSAADYTDLNSSNLLDAFQNTIGTNPDSEAPVAKSRYDSPDYESLLKISTQKSLPKIHEGKNTDQNDDCNNLSIRGNPTVILENVGHVYLSNTPWENRALSDINLKIYSGESTMIVGENGSGKTTLSWILAGLVVPSEGKITWSAFKSNEVADLSHLDTDAIADGTYISDKSADFKVEVGRRKAKIRSKFGDKYSKSNGEGKIEEVTSAIVFQHSVFQLTERDVKNSVKPIVILDDMTSEELVSACLSAVGFNGSAMLDRSIYELSGGEIKRVAIASVLALMPKVIIFDEPLAGLDFGSKLKIKSIIDSLSKMGIATIVVSHDYEEILPVCNRVIQLSGGQIVFDGKSDNWTQSNAGLL